MGTTHHHRVFSKAFEEGWTPDDIPEGEDLVVDTIVVVEETPECPGGKFVRRKSVAGGLTAPLTLSTVAAAA